LNVGFRPTSLSRYDAPPSASQPATGPGWMYFGIRPYSGHWGMAISMGVPQEFEPWSGSRPNANLGTYFSAGALLVPSTNLPSAPSSSSFVSVGPRVTATGAVSSRPALRGVRPRLRCGRSAAKRRSTSVLDPGRSADKALPTEPCARNLPRRRARSPAEMSASPKPELAVSTLSSLSCFPITATQA
jgi:hypothetical protein